MMQQGLLENNIFSFYMGMHDEDSSEVIFGAYDDTKFDGEI